MNLDALWSALESSIAFAIIWIATFCLVYLFINKLSPLHAKWQKYEGTIITAIKLAEKAIPNDTPRAGLQRLDAALQFVLKAYAEQNAGESPPTSLVRDLKEGIQIKHAELERLGNLDSV